MFKINGFIFHDQAKQVIENTLHYASSYFVPLEIIGMRMGLISGKSAFENETNLRLEFFNEELYQNVLQGQIEMDFGLELLRGEMDFCELIRCPETYKVGSIIETLSFINMSIIEAEALGKTLEFKSLLENPSTRAARNSNSKGPKGRFKWNSLGFWGVEYYVLKIWPFFKATSDIQNLCYENL